MTKTQLLKETYGAYFDELEKIAQLLEGLRGEMIELPEAQRSPLERHLNDVENQLAAYSEMLADTGIKLAEKLPEVANEKPPSGLLGRIKASDARYEQKLGTLESVREGVRKWVTLAVAGTYALALLILVIAGLCWIFDRDPALPPGLIALSDMLQKLLLPIVTLVLGFYYGGKKSD